MFLVQRKIKTRNHSIFPSYSLVKKGTNYIIDGILKIYKISREALLQCQNKPIKTGIYWSIHSIRRKCWAKSSQLSPKIVKRSCY